MAKVGRASFRISFDVDLFGDPRRLCRLTLGGDPLPAGSDRPPLWFASSEGETWALRYSRLRLVASSVSVEQRVGREGRVAVSIRNLEQATDIQAEIAAVLEAAARMNDPAMQRHVEERTAEEAAAAQRGRREGSGKRARVTVDMIRQLYKKVAASRRRLKYGPPRKEDLCAELCDTLDVKTFSTDSLDRRMGELGLSWPPV